MRRVKVLSIDEITNEIINPDIQSLLPQRYPLMTERATIKPYPMHMETEGSLRDDTSAARSQIFDCKSQGIPYQSHAARLNDKMQL